MTRDDALFLAGEARAAGIDFFSTPFSLAAVEILEEAGVPAYKVASMDVTTPYLLDAVAATGKPVILSTGMSSLEEIGTAVERLTRGGAKEVALLHCLSLYPVEASDCNLLAMVELKRAFGLPTGWSDHFPGAKACLAAYAAGAEIIETHFTLDCQTPGGDHSHSLDPAMLQGLLEDMRLFASMQGGPGFFSARPDREYAPVFRRGVHAAKPLAAGAVPGPGDLLFCRPLEGLSPGDMERLAGRPLKRAVSAHAPLKIEDFDG
jgi:sialic acid synthase SpsE